MKLLLDTHAFLWFIQGSDRLSPLALSTIQDPKNKSFLSTASLWEIAIKVSIGRLDIGESMTGLVEHQIVGNNIKILAILPAHLDQLLELPFHHKDPFDRLILAQSLVESIPVISKDEMFKQYSAQVIW